MVLAVTSRGFLTHGKVGLVEGNKFRDDKFVCFLSTAKLAKISSMQKFHVLHLNTGTVYSNLNIWINEGWLFWLWGKLYYKDKEFFYFSWNFTKVYQYTS